VNTSERLPNEVRTDAQKDPATLEREIDQTRADMDRTLGALERKLSPGQLLDEAMGFAREHGGELASNLGRSVKENPMPALLTAVGVVWMLASSNRPRASRAYANGDRFEQRDFRSGELATSGSESSSWSETGERARSSAQDAMSGIGQRAKAAADSVGEKLSSSRDTVRATIGRTSDSALAQGQRMREGFQNLFEEQPLVIGALGVALGAAIGAALPRTEQEDQLLGEMRDNTVSSIKDQGVKAYERARDTVDRVGELVGEGVDQKKSNPGGESAASRPASESDRSVNEERKPI
jgi:ElaB/YqjD/DUF883 family membrane-anchored ribosome-binding protein